MIPHLPISDPLPASESPVSVEPSPISPSRASVARWRWWVALFIIAANPLVGAILSWRPGKGADMVLPKSVPGLLVFCGVELLFFGVFLGVAWLFSRANREQLFLRNREGFKPIFWGFGYSLLMRFALMVVAIAVFTVVAVALSMMGVKPEALAAIIKAQSGGAAKVFTPAMTQSSPLYRVLMLTLVSFVVAGLREELWRVSMMASLRHLAPPAWTQTTQNVVAVGVSSGLFGLAHVYQGWVGVILTALLGIALGTMTLRHRSVWPAVFAHGFFDATSFLLLLVVAGKTWKFGSRVFRDLTA